MTPVEALLIGIGGGFGFAFVKELTEVIGTYMSAKYAQKVNDRQIKAIAAAKKDYVDGVLEAQKEDEKNGKKPGGYV